MTTATATTDLNKKQTTESSQATDGSGQLSQVVSFRLANEEYGLDIMSVQEIILMGDITEIPEVPAYIRGLINLRGKIIPIVDLRLRFGLAAGDSDEHTRIIVVSASDTVFGIVVDAVNEVLRIDLSNLNIGFHDTDDDTLKSALGTGTTFTLELVPASGAVLFLERTTPVTLDTQMALD